jgi:hypothetical protein
VALGPSRTTQIEAVAHSLSVIRDYSESGHPRLFRVRVQGVSMAFLGSGTVAAGPDSDLSPGQALGSWPQRIGGGRSIQVSRMLDQAPIDPSAQVPAWHRDWWPTGKLREPAVTHGPPNARSILLQSRNRCRQCCHSFSRPLNGPFRQPPSATGSYTRLLVEALPPNCILLPAWELPWARSMPQLHWLLLVPARSFCSPGANSKPRPATPCCARLHAISGRF